MEDGLTETLTLCAVEWSGGKVYIGAIIKNRFTYCKSPIGQIKVIDDKTVYASKEASGSLQLNPSDDIDTKDLNKQYIIWEGQGQIIGYRIIRNSVDFMDFEKHVDAYVK